MTSFDDRYNGHAVHGVLQELLDSVGSAQEGLELADEEQRATYSRFRRVIGHVKHTLDNGDSDLIAPSVLNGLAQSLEDLKGKHQTFIKDKQCQPLTESGDAVLIRLFRFPNVPPEEHIEELTEALQQFRDLAEGSINQVKGTAEDALEKHKELQQQVAATKKKLDEYDTQFEAQKGRLDQLITDQQTKFGQEQQQRNEQFAENQNNRNAGFQSLTESAKEQVKAFLSASTEKFDTFRKQHEEKAAGALEQLQGHLDHAEKIVGLIGNTGMAGHYQKVADRERRAAGVFRSLAIFFFVTMVAMVCVVVFSKGANGFSWYMAIFRVAVAITLLAPAYYCARESSKHRAVANRNRRIELELASINPYLERLDGQKGNEIVEKLATQYFGGNGPRTHEDSDDPLKDVFVRGDQLLAVAERVAKIIK